jgi:hypothetical protein
MTTDVSGETKLISISTKRYSEFFRRLLGEYSAGTSVEIDLRSYPASEFPNLIETWCTNAKIKGTREFRLIRGNDDLFGFHDSPDELWAACSELPFVERLASEQLLQYRIGSIRVRPLWSQVAMMVFAFAALYGIFRLLAWLL